MGMANHSNNCDNLDSIQHSRNRFWSTSQYCHLDHLWCDRLLHVSPRGQIIFRTAKALYTVLLPQTSDKKLQLS
jgi:hypothetical protein